MKNNEYETSKEKLILKNLILSYYCIFTASVDSWHSTYHNAASMMWAVVWYYNENSKLDNNNNKINLKIPYSVVP